MVEQKDVIVVEAYSSIVLLAELTTHRFFESEYFKEMDFKDKFIKNELKNKTIITKGNLYLVIFSLLVMPTKTAKNSLEKNIKKLNQWFEPYRKIKESSLSNVEVVMKATTEIEIEFRKEFVVFSNEIFIPYEDMKFLDKALNEYFVGYIEYLKSKS